MGDRISENKQLEIGHEYKPADEEKYIGLMIDDLEEHLRKLYPEGKTLRQAHPKMHGCVKAEFTVSDNLDPALKVGIFKEPKTYNAYIRFSNAKSKIQHDKHKDVRGMAIKLTGVGGEKLVKTSTDADSQDFVLISHDIFISKNVKEFYKVIHALRTGPIALIGLLLNNFPILNRLMKSSKQHDDILAIPYYSTTPYLFGENKAVKYHAKPSIEAYEGGKMNKADEDFLRTNMVKALSERDICFDFMIQFQTDPYLMPIEDPTVRWNSPFIKVARIRIPKQIFDTDEHKHMGDDFSFSPWHSLREHRPLGGLNRARERIYYALSKFWHGRNDKYTPKP